MVKPRRRTQRRVPVELGSVSRMPDASAPAAATGEMRSMTAEGVSLWLVAAFGLVSSFLGRGLVPALPGSSTGIGRFIGAASSLSSFLSQLVAAGAVAFVL